MIKKELDIKKITKESINKSFDQHGFKKTSLLEAAPSQPKITLFDTLPFLKIKSETFANIAPKTIDESVFRKAFARFHAGSSSLKDTIAKINDALGISVDENLEPVAKAINSNNLNKTFAALSIINVMYYAAKLDPKATGLFFEPLVAGLLEGVSSGAGGQASDIKQKKYINGNSTDIQTSLKTIVQSESGEFVLSVRSVVDKARELFKKTTPPGKFNLLVALKNIQGEEAFYTFYNIEITKDNILNVIYREGETPIEDVLRGYFSSVTNAIDTSQESKDEATRQSASKPKKFMDSFFTRSFTDVFTALDSFEEELAKQDKETQDYINRALKRGRGIASDEEDKPASLEEAKQTNEPKYKSPSKYRTPNVKPEKRALIGPIKPSEWRAAQSKIPKLQVEWQGTIFLSEKFYEENLTVNNKQLIQSIKLLLEPLSTALNKTNDYFFSDNANDKINSLTEARQNAEFFSTHAAIAIGAANQTQNTTSNTLPENLNLTREAAIVMEILQRMEG